MHYVLTFSQKSNIFPKCVHFDSYFKRCHLTSHISDHFYCCGSSFDYFT
jgi:hypothetical protein